MKNILLISALSVLLSSCFYDRVELDLNENNTKIAVEAWITDLEEPQFVKITRTVNYLGDQQPDYVDDAIVQLNDEVQTYDLIQNEPGVYYLPVDWVARIGANYQLTIDHNGEKYVSTHVMRACPIIEDLGYDIITSLAEKDSTAIYEVVFSFRDIQGEGDAYYGVDYLKGTTVGDTLFNGDYTDDEFFDGQYFDEISLTEEDRLFTLGDTAVVEIFSIGKETFQFLIDIEQEVFRGGPFDPPPANIRSNISNGAVGYFIASGANRREIVIE